MAQKIVVELTEAEARALYLLAMNSAVNEQDASEVLLRPATVAAGYRAIEKLNNARSKKWWARAATRAKRDRVSR